MQKIILALLFAFSICLPGISAILDSTDYQKQNFKRIWLRYDPKTFSDLPDYSLVDGIYLSSNSIPYLHFQKDYVIALQLDEAMNTGFTDQQLPGLATLSAISNQELLHDYLSYFRSQSKATGYDFLVLPKLENEQHPYFKVIHKIHDFDPDYFLMHDHLAFNVTVNKKEFASIYRNAHALVYDLDILKKELKLILKELKNQKRFQTEDQQYIEKLNRQYPPFYTPITQILYQIWKSSVIVLQKDVAFFPYQKDSIAIIDEQSGLELINQLKNYFPVVLNARFDAVPSGIPVVIDARENLISAQQFALSLQSTNPIIWISDYASLANVNASVILITPDIHRQHDFILPQMVYGAEGIFGENHLPLPEYLDSFENKIYHGQLLLTHAFPEWVGIDPMILDSLDVLALEMIHGFASPGAQVMVVKDSKIIFDKSYGHVTYDSMIRVEPYTLYDIASLTKVAATTPAIMLLIGQGKIHLDSSIGYYLPAYIGSNKEKITVREILSHKSGMRSYIPFWKRSVNREKISFFYYKTKEDSLKDRRSFDYVPDVGMLDSLQSWLKASGVDEINSNGGYRYSDLGFMILHQLVETVSGQRMAEFIYNNLYRPLGMQRTVFNPIPLGFPVYHIAPTEFDNQFRREQIWGVVHDRNAAIFGGVAGHAGLFSNTKDLAVLAQMMLQNGYYGDRSYIAQDIVQQFNFSYFPGNRRGLGWDKPGDFNPNISKLASPDSYGHTGFTGTILWIDPQYNLIFIFLSNRIFPDGENQKLIHLDIRRRMHDLVYRSIK